MDHNAAHPTGNETGVLYSMLGGAFSPADIEPASVTAETPSTAPTVKPPDELASEGEGWKAEYEAQVQTWRTQSAHAREKAEKERARWEEIRASQLNDPQQQQQQDVGYKNITTAGESPAQTYASSGTPNPAGTAGSQKWEKIPSTTTSSYPSLSFPEGFEEEPPKPIPTERTSATLAVFDNSLPPRRRLTALLCSLAINLFLPFLNGVMLGFGEILAKNALFKWFGWRSPDETVAAVGIGKFLGR